MLLKLLRAMILGLLIALILLAAIPSLRVGATFFSQANNSSGTTPDSYSSGVRRAVPAVVNVYNRSASAATNTLGSGVIMNSRGYILTNRHVINNAEQIIIALQDGRLFEAMLVGSDKLTDLAVLKITATNLPVIPINPTRLAHVGDIVMAIGNPYNIGLTVTQGIISATGRIGLSSSGRQNFLQTDASINHGNSGGALINSLGELMGINTLSFDKSNDGETPEGIGFAIPAALSVKIMDKLIRDGRVIRGYIGITGREIPRLHVQNTSVDRLQGIIINEVAAGGPAAKAGIQINDVILNVNGKPAISALETMDQVAEIRPGSVITIVVLRHNQRLTLPVTIQEYPQN
ncbi:outer membrane-stress sensor serine endopeptidase DegS [Enterobacteriaceae bacterium LUAb1]